MLSGQYAFHDNNSQVEIYKKILRGKYDLKKGPWLKISHEAKDLVKKLLTQDPFDRYSYKQILRHPFMQRYLLSKKNT